MHFQEPLSWELFHIIYFVLYLRQGVIFQYLYYHFFYIIFLTKELVKCYQLLASYILFKICWWVVFLIAVIFFVLSTVFTTKKLNLWFFWQLWKNRVRLYYIWEEIDGTRIILAWVLKFVTWRNSVMICRSNEQLPTIILHSADGFGNRLWETMKIPG